MNMLQVHIEDGWTRFDLSSLKKLISVLNNYNNYSIPFELNEGRYA